MFDRDLAALYGVETKVLNQAVKRNIKRFPMDFMFQLNRKESEIWRSQIVTTSQDRFSIESRNTKNLPYVFTEQGVAMLSSVLKSEKAIEVNIQIIRIFTKLREILNSNQKIAEKIRRMEKRYDEEIGEIFKILGQLIKEEEKPKKRIGFNTG